MIPRFVSNPNPNLYLTGRYVVVDFETTNHEYGTALNAANRLVLACWYVVSNGRVAAKHLFGGEYDMLPLLKDLEECDFIVAQNAKFELQWLHRCGWDVGARPVYDTMLAEWVILANEAIGKLDLDSIAKKYGIPSKDSVVKKMISAGICPSQIPKSLLLRYCMRDVLATHQAMLAQLKVMEGTRLLPIVYTRCLTTLALADIERSGICLDQDAVREEWEKTSQKYAEVSRELDKMSGGMNMNSRPQKAEFIYDVLGFKELIDPYTKKPAKTPGGARKTDATTLGLLEATTPKQKKFLELKTQQGKLGAALSKTLDFCLGVCEEQGGVFYGELRQGTTRTHRLSSAGRRLEFKMFPKPKSCQFQNYPNEYKRLITARHEGWYVAEGDGSQLEFRVGGHLGHDAQIMSDVIGKEDIHSDTMREMNKAGERVNRRGAKPFTFRPMYGGTSGSPAVEAYCKFFAEKYHELNEAQTQWALEAADKKVLETEWGMKYYFPKVYVNKFGTIIGKQKVFNYPIQALATAEIIPIGLVFFWYRTRNARLIITNTVHDSIICEVPKEEIELFQRTIVQALTTDVYTYLVRAYNMYFTVPLGVGIKLGSHWGVTAFTDAELTELAQPLADEYAVEIDDGELAIDVPNPYLQKEAA